MSRLDSEKYVKLVSDAISQLDFWDLLQNKTVLITGATGMIGTFLVDMLMQKNKEGLNCYVIACGRDKNKAEERLPWFEENLFSFLELDVSKQKLPDEMDADFVIHLASTTHPLSYSSNPIGTIEINVFGMRNVLEFAASHKSRVLCASSVEIYGENRGDVDCFDEEYCGYIDCNTQRACYTESKRLCEAMCQAYRAQKDVQAVIARIARVYGPTLLPDDTKALSQFIHKAISGEDVVLKSKGTQRFSYLHVADAATGLLYVLMKGSDGEAYNLADENSNIQLKELASLVAESCGVEVVFDLPDEVENAGYSKATLALMNPEKAKSLGWQAECDIKHGILETVKFFQEGIN